MWDDDKNTTKDIQFRFRRFCAPAKHLDALRQVYRLTVPPSAIQRWLPSWTPQLVHSWLQRLLPEWFLPATVILKERNPERANFYENEIDTYSHLQSLQGTHIPLFFGEVAVSYPPSGYQLSKRPTPAILLEDIKGGKPLHDLSIEELTGPRLLEELEGIYSRLTEAGVVHGDPRLHNFLRVEDRVVAIDFEFSYLLPSAITNEDDLGSLECEIERRKREAEGVKTPPLGSNIRVYWTGSELRQEQLGTDVRSLVVG